MEYEQSHYPNDQIYIDEQELHALSFPTEDFISPSISEDGSFDERYTERLLQIETELMDFDGINQEIDHRVQEVSTDHESHSLKESPDHHEEELLERCSLTDLMLMGAQAVEARNCPLASTIIAKLNNLLITDQENAFNRLALFFTQGLHYKSINTNPPKTLPIQQANTMSAFQLLQELSPYVKFAHFTANQAILEASKGDQELHVVDFDIMEGMQWPPLMVDLAMRSQNTSLTITATIRDLKDAAMVQQTGTRLTDFADSINLPFVFKQLVLAEEQDFERINKVGHDHTLVANCMIHQLHMPNTKLSLLKLKTFLNGMTKLSPKIVVLVEDELFNFTKLPSMSYVNFFCEALHHYTALYDSLVSSFSDEYRSVGLRQIEEELLRVRIVESVSEFPSENEEKMLWEEAYASLKQYFKQIPMSYCNISQAKFLVSLFNGAYWVQHDKCRLGLCWKSRLLTTASVWVSKLQKESL